MPRLYWADWLRTLAIYTVLIEHALVDIAFVSEYARTDTNFVKWKEGFQRQLFQYGIPLFFYISGVSSCYFNTEKPLAFFNYLWSKILRLMVPLVVAFTCITIPAGYISQGWCTSVRHDFENVEWN